LENLEKILAPFERRMRPSEFCGNVRALLQSLDTRTQLLASSGHAISAGTLELDTRGYRALIRLIEELESLFVLMGIEQEERSIEFYIERMKAASIWTRYNPSAHSGCVLVTSLEQSIGEDPEYFFIAGLIEGALPSVYQPQVFLMASMQRGERKQLLEERILFYNGITNFNRELFLSCPKHASSGTEISRSVFLDELKEVITVEESPATRGIFSYRDLYLTSAQLRAQTPQLFEEMLSDPVRVPATAFYTRTLREHVPQAIQAQEARTNGDDSIYRGFVDPALLTEREREALEYNRSRIWSVTQLELYASCAFKFFAKQVLSLGESQEREDGLDARDRGTVVHDVLREFLTARRERKAPAIQDIPEDQLAEAYREVHDIAERQLAEIGSEHPFWRLDAERLLSEDRAGRPGDRTGVLWKFIEHERSLVEYEPRPKFFEVSFGAEGAQTGKRSERDAELSRDEPVELGGIRLRGKIDRIDVGGNAFTLVDYKSGKNTSSFADINRGLALQLPLYLRAAEDLLRTHVPELKGVAALYHKVLDPKSDRKLGLALKEYMETSFEKLSGHAGLLKSSAELEALIEATIEKAKGYVDGVAAGAFPLTSRDLAKKQCPKCPYRSVCRVREAQDLDVLR
jgi:ATP-dependent helicase/nuclease subunit B